MRSFPPTRCRDKAVVVGYRRVVGNSVGHHLEPTKESYLPLDVMQVVSTVLRDLRLRVVFG